MGRKYFGKRRAISPFSTVFFRRLILLTHKYQGLLGKGLTLYRTTNSLVQIENINFADDKVNVNKKFKFGLGRVENIVGKGENAGHQHFLLFPQCFQKPSVAGSLKVGIVW